MPIRMGVRRRGFYVLRKTRIPAVLVECGFLTNPTEASYAQSSAYRQKLAEQIARGVRSRGSVSSSARVASNEATVPLQPFIDQTRVRDRSSSRSKRSSRRSSKSKSSKSKSSKSSKSKSSSTKKKTSKARRDKRRANTAISVPARSDCPHCHHVVRPHHACPNCGQYRGREVTPLREVAP